MSEHSIVYNAWQSPSLAEDIVGRQSTVNPMGSVPSFRGAAPVNELGVHGVLDTPEHTAQTAPSVVSFAHSMLWDTNLPSIDKDALHASLGQFVFFQMSSTDCVKWAEDSAFTVKRAFATGGVNPPINRAVGAGILLTDIDTDDRALVSLLPTDSQYKSPTNIYYTAAGDCSQMAGVVMDHTHIGSERQCRTTLAIEHAVEIQFYYKTEAARRTHLKYWSNAGDRVWFTV